MRASLENGDIDKILDPNLQASQPNIEGLWKVLDVAMRSVEPKGVHRPTMSKVVDELREAVAFEGTHSKGTSHTNTPSNISDIRFNSCVGFDSDSQIPPRWKLVEYISCAWMLLDYQSFSSRLHRNVYEVLFYIHHVWRQSFQGNGNVPCLSLFAFYINWSKRGLIGAFCVTLYRVLNPSS